MNYSESMKQKRDKANRRFKRMFFVALIFGAVVAFILGLSVKALCRSSTKANELDFLPMEPPPVVTVGPTAVFCETVDVTPSPEPEPSPTLLGTYRITAYCSCEKCCGEWAKNRPGGLVYGAAGIELHAGFSCASPLPFGTVVEIEGLGEYTVQDRMATWVIEKYGENLIDIYFDNHEAACDFGCQYLKVYEKECS